MGVPWPSGGGRNSTSFSCHLSGSAYRGLSIQDLVYFSQQSYEMESHNILKITALFYR